MDHKKYIDWDGEKMGEWKTCQLGDLVTFQRGYDLPKTRMQGGEYPVVGSNGIIGYHNEYTTESPSITIGRSGNVGKPFLYKGRSWSHNTSLFIKEYKNVDPIFIFYFLQTLDLGNYAGGSAVPTLNRNHIHTLNVCVPIDIDEQRRIAAVLSVLSEKIEENEKINDNLLEQAKVLFKSWFVDFELFSADGAMPSNWRIGAVEEIIELHDFKRIPLSGAQRAKMKKLYPYYGAASLMDYVDSYLFDGIYLLLGEDGTVIDDKGFPILQYVDGKFWVNNHAHILTGRHGFSVEELYLFFSLTNIKSIVTGAVQPKISQGNLKRIPAIIPPESVLKDFDNLIQPLFSEIRNLKEESASLIVLRNNLLPKLMSGEFDVSNIEL